MLALTERPVFYRRGDAMVAIFPSRPYWFSASPEIERVLHAFRLEVPAAIEAEIARTLDLPPDEAADVFRQVRALLHGAGVLRVDGQVAAVETHQPDFQVTEAENVLVIATTQACNLSCAMCYASASRRLPRELTTAEVKAIIDQLGTMPWDRGISRVALTGGELFSRPDALELVDYVHARGYFVQVNTNATLLRDDQIARLATYPRLKLSVSVDGLARSHEHIRGVGTFTRTTETVRRLTARGVSVAINMFVHAGNVDEIGDVLAHADALGVHGVNCLNMMHVGRGNTAEAKQRLVAVPLAVFYRRVFEAIRHSPRFQELMANSTFANQIMGLAAGVKSHGCGVGTNRAVYVHADGTLYPCADTAVPAFRLGNLRSDTLPALWEGSPILRALRALDVDTMNPTCAACDVRYLCAGGCRGENFQTTNDLRGPHFKCAEIHDSILELMWILTEAPELFRHKTVRLHEAVRAHAASA